MMTFDAAFSLVREEIERARSMHPGFPSAHHGYAVIREELDELWDEVKADRLLAAQKEAVQVAATAIRFMTELKG